MAISDEAVLYQVAYHVKADHWSGQELMQLHDLSMEGLPLNPVFCWGPQAAHYHSQKAFYGAAPPLRGQPSAALSVRRSAASMPAFSDLFSGKRLGPRLDTGLYQYAIENRKSNSKTAPAYCYPRV